MNDERAADIAQALASDAPPTDSLPPDAGPAWFSITEIGQRPTYREGLLPQTTGFVTLDTALRGGFRPECLYILGGRTGSAKSTLALNIARRVAIDGGSVLFFKLEESLTEAVWRMHAAAAQVDFNKLADGAKHEEDERARLIDGWTLIRELPIRLSESRELTRIEAIAEQHVSTDGRLMVIDQLSMIDAPGNVGYERATEVSGRLRLLARRLRVPILLVVQVGREASKKHERLSCNDLRDSGALENDATAVLLIDKARRGDAPRWHTDPLTLEIIVAKNRYGMSTRADDKPLELHWWPQTCRVEDAAAMPGGEQ